MAYAASTLTLNSPAPLTGAGQQWRHTSADATAVVDASGFIANGGSYGMKVGDVLQHTDSGTGIITSHRVVTVSATFPGVVDLSDGVVVGSGTNTD